MNKLYQNEYIKKLSIEDLGFFSFLIGVFLLASAVGVGIIFLFISLLISFMKPSKIFLNRWNLYFLISAFLMLISTFIHFQNIGNYPNLNLDPKLSLLGLANWIPFFLCFCGFQKYLNTVKKRIITSRLLISGSIPVIFSGILQLFNINGPFELFNGLIIWFQKPISDIGSLSGFSIIKIMPVYGWLWFGLFVYGKLKKKRLTLQIN